MAPSRRPAPAPAPALALSLVLALAPLRARACSAPPGGCLLSLCDQLVPSASFPIPPPASTTQPSKYMGYYYGSWNKNPAAGPQNNQSLPGSPFISYEVYPNVETQYHLDVVDSWYANTLRDCCRLCARTAGCTLYQYFEKPRFNQIKTGTGALASRKPGGAYTDYRQCYLLTGGSVAGTYPTPGPNNNGPYGTPFSGTKTQQLNATNKLIPPSFVGGLCNPNASVVNDPHFVSAQGTRFEFNGELGKSFCLISDEGLNVNVQLDGYLDDRTVGATRLENGKALRTWIKDIGITWLENGVRRTAELMARRGKQETRGEGYLARVAIDGKEVVPPQPGVASKIESGTFELQHVGLEKKGWYEMEEFSLKVGGKFEAVVHMRPAHPLLQTTDDSQVHFNVLVHVLHATPKVHGVLGQTFRPTTGQNVKALEYSLLSKLMGTPIVADGESGLGFLDGSTADYVTSSITTEDSKYSMPLSVLSGKAS